MSESREPNFRRGEQVPDEAHIEDNFTVGERVEVNGVSGTIDHIGGFQVRSDVSTRIMNKRRNDVRDPTNHQTGEQINLRAGSLVEIKMSNNTWVPGTLLIKYYRVILDGREPAMVSHRDIRRLTQVVALPPIGSRSAVAVQAPLTNINAPAPTPAQAPEAQAPQAAPQQIVDNGNYYPGQQVELEVPLHSNNWIPGTITNFKSFGVIAFRTVGIKNKETGLVQHQETESTNYADMPIGSAVLYKNRINDTTWYGADLIFKQYNVSYRNPQTGALITNQSYKHYYIRIPQGQAPAPAPSQPVVIPPPLAPARQQRQAPPTPASPAPAPVPLEQPLPAYGALAPAPRQIQMGVEPNPPYRFGENVECLSQDVWVPAVLSGVRTDSLYAVVILNPETGRRNQRPINMVRTLLEQPAINLNVRIGDTVLYEANENRPIGNFIQGIVVDKMYNVAYTMPNGIFIRNDKSTNEIRRPLGQVAPVEQPRAPVEQPRAAAPTPRVAVAFEIHNAFDSFKFDNFMNIIKKQSNFKNKDAPLQPLIDNVNANPKLSPEKKADLTGKIERIFATLRQYSNYAINIENIMNCIQYVLMQPQGFIDIYINTFITDCLKAYATGNSQSCIKGMYERIYFSFRDTVSTICLDKIQGTGAAPLCKPEYIEIFNCFYAEMPTEMLNDYAKDWVKDRGEAVENLSEEARIEDFVEFVRRRVNNDANFRESERSVRKYAAANINSFMGGQRKRKKTLKKRLNPKRKSKKY